MAISRWVGDPICWRCADGLGWDDRVGVHHWRIASGIHAGALSGWVFLLFCGFGAFCGLILKRRFALP